MEDEVEVVEVATTGREEVTAVPDRSIPKETLINSVKVEIFLTSLASGVTSRDITLVIVQTDNLNSKKQ